MFDAAPIEVNAIKFDIAFGFLGRKEKKSAGRLALSILRKSVCEHQGYIAQNFLLGNEFHRALKLALHSKNKEAVDKSLKELNRLHLDSLRNAWKSSIAHLQNYFAVTHKSPIAPRCCIKGTSTEKDADGIQRKIIVDVLREDGTRSLVKSQLSENSGFLYAEGGSYFIENNIPEAVLLRRYVNPRLNHRFASLYKQPSRLTKKYYSSEDKDWIKCWDVDVSGEPRLNSCYKSTLIIPMTLVNNELSEEFYSETSVGLASREDRSIYGFLCLDHPSRAYFHESDVNVGYIFADLLSIYQITNDALVARSKIHEEAKNFLKEFERV